MYSLLYVDHRREDNLIASFPLDCPACARETIHVYSEVVEKAFWLSLIPLLTRSRGFALRCSECTAARWVPDEQMEEVRSLAEDGAAPFRICTHCGTHNDPDAVLCQTCREVLRHTLFPRKGAARVVAILLTALFALMLLVTVYSCFVETFM